MPRRRPTVPSPTDLRAPELRIVGGTFRGRKLLYSGDRRVRPMKDRVREAVFNLLGPAVRGTLAIDLFGGTGALGLEALSRGAARAIFLEQHYPTAAILRQNIASLGVEARCEVIRGDTFVCLARGPALPADMPWVVFVSPPYEFYISRTDDMLRLVGGLLDRAPAESLFVVESDERFDFTRLPRPDAWDIRPYPPAIVGLHRAASSPPPE